MWFIHRDLDRSAVVASGVHSCVCCVRLNDWIQPLKSKGQLLFSRPFLVPAWLIWTSETISVVLAGIFSVSLSARLWLQLRVPLRRTRVCRWLRENKLIFYCGVVFVLVLAVDPGTEWSVWIRFFFKVLIFRQSWVSCFELKWSHRWATPVLPLLILPVC